MNTLDRAMYAACNILASRTTCTAFALSLLAAVVAVGICDGPMP